MKELKKFEKNEKCIFGRKTKAPYLMMKVLLAQKLAYTFASLGEGKWFSYRFPVLRKISQ